LIPSAWGQLIPDEGSDAAGVADRQPSWPVAARNALPPVSGHGTRHLARSIASESYELNRRPRVRLESLVSIDEKPRSSDLPAHPTIAEPAEHQQGEQDDDDDGRLILCFLQIGSDSRISSERRVARRVPKGVTNSRSAACPACQAHHDLISLARPSSHRECTSRQGPSVRWDDREPLVAMRCRRLT